MVSVCRVDGGNGNVCFQKNQFLVRLNGGAHKVHKKCESPPATPTFCYTLFFFVLCWRYRQCTFV